MIEKTLQKELARKSQLAKYATNKYLTDDTPNFRYIKNKFFQRETPEKIEALVVGSGCFSVISNKIANFTGKAYISTSDEHIDTNKVARDIVSVGYGVIGISKLTQGYKIHHIEAKKYFKDDGIDCTIDLYELENKADKTYFALIKRFGVGYIDNELYVLTNIKDLTSAKRVPLDTLPQTAELKDRELTGLTIPAIQVAGSTKDQPLFDMIEDRVLSMDRKKVMFDTQFLAYAESFVLFKGISSIKESAVAKQIRGA